MRKQVRLGSCLRTYVSFHNAQIADAEDDKSSIREAYINNVEFFDCAIAAPIQHQTRPLKTHTAASAKLPLGRGGGAAGAFEDAATTRLIAAN